MADKGDGEDRAVFRLQDSTAQARPSPGASSNNSGELPGTLGENAIGFARRVVAGPLLLLAWAGHRRSRRESETGEGSSVVNSLPGDSGLTQGGDLVVLQGRKEQLIKLLLEDDSRTTDVLVKGGLGITALVRKTCEDVRMRGLFDTIAWISLPRERDPELIREEILLQLLFENAPLHNDFDSADGPLVEDVGFSSIYMGRCLVVVDNLDDQRTLDALKKVHFSAETYQVIFIARRDMGPWNSSLYEDGRRLETFELEDLSKEEPWAHVLKKSPEGDFPSPLMALCQFLVRKFDGLPAAVVLQLGDRKEERNTERKSMIFPSFEINDKWAPMILPSNFPSFNLIQQVLEILYANDRGLCLWYLSIFPEDSVMGCKRVSRLWAAEGFLPDPDEAEGFVKFLHSS